MIAFEVTAPRYSTVVIGEARRSSPLYDRGEWENDRPATTAFDAQGRIVIYSSANPEGALFAEAWTRRVPLPAWAKKKKG